MGATLGLTSCNDFLDMTPTDKISDKGVWTNVSTAEYSVNYLYSYIYDVVASQCVAGETEALTDQLKYGSYNYNSLCFIPSEIAYGGSNLTATYVDAYLGYWGSWYSAVRRTNQEISSLKKYGTLAESDAVRLEAEMRFVRAYLYFDLMKRYKEVIIYDEDLTAITENKALNTEKEGWDFIQQDLEYAAANLPEAKDAKGRANKGQAWAFMSRAMLYAERWEAAKKAAEEVEKLDYALEADYADSYMKPITEGNKEAILQYCFDRKLDITYGFDFYYTPGGDYKLNGQTGGGYGTPTQEMVESYEYAEEGGFPDWSAWHAEGVTDTPPYEELEPRFQASILYNGASWKDRTIESFVGGSDGFCVWNKEPEPPRPHHDGLLSAQARRREPRRHQRKRKCTTCHYHPLRRGVAEQGRSLLPSERCCRCQCCREGYPRPCRTALSGQGRRKLVESHPSGTQGGTGLRGTVVLGSPPLESGTRAIPYRLERLSGARLAYRATAERRLCVQLCICG